VSSFKVILFDWDGTVIDSLSIKVGNAGRLFEKRFGIGSDGFQKVYRNYSGIPRRQLFDKVLKEFGFPPLLEDEFQDLSAAFTEMNRQSLTLGAIPGVIPPDTRPALEMLGRLGCELYVSSSAAREELTSIASALCLDGYFREILGSTPGFGKGAEHVHYVQGKEQVTLEEMLFVGDDISDLELARQAGIAAVGRAGTHSA
jgi:phosphoglycolate phosphatase-like HAD superfamily hydrolase